MYFALAVAIATSFWTARDVPVPCQPAPVHVAYEALPAALVTIGDETVLETPFMAARDCAVLLSPATAYARRTDPAYYCASVVHEVGHIAGLPHRNDGIMNERITRNRIWDCAHWKAFAKRNRLAVTPSRQRSSPYQAPGS